MRTNLLRMLVLFVFFGCAEDDGSMESDCAGTICTLEFAAIGIQVLDQTDAPVALDAYTVKRDDNGQDITIPYDEWELQAMQETGSYVVVTDAMASQLRKQSLRVIFEGFLAGEKILTHRVTVGADCCHVRLLEGKKTVLIDS